MCKNASSHWQRGNASRVKQDFLIPMSAYERIITFFNWCVKSNSLTRVIRSSYFSSPYSWVSNNIPFPKLPSLNQWYPTNSSTWRQAAFTPFLFSSHCYIQMRFTNSWVPPFPPMQTLQIFSSDYEGDHLAITWSAF